MIKAIGKKIVHTITGTRKFYYKNIEELARGINNKDILEIGSGKQVKGAFPYSAKQYFDESNAFLQTDINPDFGHQVLDITRMDTKNKFDYVLCLNVLEHVYEYDKAILNIHKSLKPKGVMVAAVPVNYPLHDEPHDYWRFTEHSLRRMFDGFSDVKIMHRGKREFPFGYYIEAKK